MINAMCKIVYALCVGGFFLLSTLPLRGADQTEIDKLIYEARNSESVGVLQDKMWERMTAERDRIDRRLTQQDRMAIERDWMTSQKDLYEELIRQCFKSEENMVYLNGAFLYGAYLREMPFHSENKELRALFFESMDRMDDDREARSAERIISSMNHITEAEFLEIIKDTDIGIARWRAKPTTQHGADMFYPIYYGAVHGLEGNPFDTFMDIVVRHSDLQKRFENSICFWTKNLDDLRAARLSLDYMNTLEPDSDDWQDLLKLIQPITYQFTKRSILDELNKPEDRAMLQEYFDLLSKVAQFKNNSIRFDALQEMLKLGAEFPEYSETAMALASEKVNDWKAGDRAQYIEEQVQNIAKMVALREKARNDAGAADELAKMREKRRKGIESAERMSKNGD